MMLIFENKCTLKNSYIMSEEFADMQEWCSKKVGNQDELWAVQVIVPHRLPTRLEFQFKDKSSATEFYLTWSEFLE